MKHGVSNTPESEFQFWVLPDKPSKIRTLPLAGGGAISEPNWMEVTEQAERYRDLLGQSCRGKWMETNNRYFFELEEDYQMFLVMSSLTS